MTNTQFYEIITTLILAALLFFPVSKMVWAISVRRLRRKLARELSKQELHGQLVRARFISIFLVLVFAYLFNHNLLKQL